MDFFQSGAILIFLFNIQIVGLDFVIYLFTDAPINILFC